MVERGETHHVAQRVFNFADAAITMRVIATIASTYLKTPDVCTDSEGQGQPDILIVEGVNVLQAARLTHHGKALAEKLSY